MSFGLPDIVDEGEKHHFIAGRASFLMRRPDMPSNPTDDIKRSALLTGPPQQLLGDADVTAQILGVSKSYLAKLRMKGEGPAYVLLNGMIRYVLPEIPSWVEKHRCASTSDPINPSRGRGRFVAKAQKARAKAKQLQPA
jgi:hypothetical protein